MRETSPHIFVVIPAYNEETAIAETIDDLRRSCPSMSIVVVDDCSADRTHEIALSQPIHVVRHPLNLGQGAALKTGIDYAVANGGEIIVTYDADGQMSAQDIPKMVEPIAKGEADVTLGTRFGGVEPQGLSRPRRVLLRLAVWYTRITTRSRFSDAHNGFRAMTRDAARSLTLDQNGMAHASEIANEIVRLKLAWREVPVLITYTEYSKKKGQKIGGAIDILADLFWGGRK